MDIAERGLGGPSRLEKHSSSSETEVQGLLDRTPPRNGSTSRLGLQHSVLAANGSSSQADGQQHLAELGGAKDPGTSGYTRSSFEVMAGGAAAAGGIGGGSSSTLRRVAGLRQDSSDSLGFEGEPPSSPLLAVSSASGGGGGGGGGGSGASHLRSVSFLTAVLMGVALCFHSLLEGAAMGAQATIGCAAPPIHCPALLLAAALVLAADNCLFATVMTADCCLLLFAAAVCRLLLCADCRSETC
jgi:zinc transporter 1/2/3